MHNKTPDIISEIADVCGGTIHECVNNLGDGNVFATMSMPLPKDHWLYEMDEQGFTPNPTYELLIGGCRARRYFEDLLQPGIRSGIKAATRCGRDEDFDPDALARNVVIGHFGVYTADGLSGGDDARLFDPPNPGSIKRLLTVLALAVADGQLSQDEVIQAVSQEGQADAIRVYDLRESERRAEYEAWRREHGVESQTIADVSVNAPTNLIPPVD